MLPRVKITFANGALGQVEALADGCLGFLALGAQEVDQFTLNHSYTISNLGGLEALGVTAENNPNLYRHVKDFYAEAGDGTELWLMGFEKSSFASVLDKDTAEGAKALLRASNGKIRGLIAFKTPKEGSVSTPQPGKEGSVLTPQSALDGDVAAALPKAQGLGEWATEELHAPVFTLIEGYNFNGNAMELANLTEMQYNRVGIVIGDTAPTSRNANSGDTAPDNPDANSGDTTPNNPDANSENTAPTSRNACMGIVAGRIAASPVQRKISRVKDGALTPLNMYVGTQSVEQADVKAIHKKGYITFTTFVGKAGYFIADDNLATAVEDDYRSLTNRRVIDKAYRIAYNTLLESLNDEVPIASDGSLSPAWCAALASRVEQAIVSNMTANGNLGNDPGDPDDTGVTCQIDYRQNILATSRLAVGLRVKPNGYAKYIDVELGFKAA